MVSFEDERDGMWFDIVAYPIIVDTGEVKRVAIIARDITEKKAARLHYAKVNNRSGVSWSKESMQSQSIKTKKSCF